MFKRRKGLRTAVLFLSLVLAAACALFLFDPWSWFREKRGSYVPEGEFPGVEEPPLYPSAGDLPYQTLNVLILGLDHGLGRPQQGNQRSDVIMLAHVDFSRKKICLLSIPRDSFVEIPGHGRSKINEAYALGGPMLARATVERVTGMSVSRHLVLDFDEFRWLVDLFGGVQVILENPIADPKVGYIPAGNQHLNGDQALIMARSRDYPHGDLDRVRQQQRILIQALYQGKRMASSPGAAWFLAVALDSLETDFTREEVISLAREFASFPVVDVQGGVAPGSLGTAGGASIIQLDTAGLRELVRAVETECSVPEKFR